MKPFLVIETEAEFDRLVEQYRSAGERMNVAPPILSRSIAAARDFVNMVRTWKAKE